MSSKKKKRSCPFSSSKPRAKKRKKAFNSDVATELASSDKGSFYNQDEWLEEIASHEPDTSESVEISASRLKIRLEDTEDEQEGIPQEDVVSWKMLYRAGLLLVSAAALDRFLVFGISNLAMIKDKVIAACNMNYLRSKSNEFGVY